MASIFRFHIFAFRSTMQRVSAKNSQWTPIVSKKKTVFGKQLFHIPLCVNENVPFQKAISDTSLSARDISKSV